MDNYDVFNIKKIFIFKNYFIKTKFKLEEKERTLSSFIPSTYFSDFFFISEGFKLKCLNLGTEVQPNNTNLGAKFQFISHNRSIHFGTKTNFLRLFFLCGADKKKIMHLLLSANKKFFFDLVHTAICRAYRVKYRQKM